MDKILLEIIGLSYSQSQSGSYALILGEQGSRRRLPIIIGAFEAQAVALGLENMQTPRPMTHDLIKNIFGFFEIPLVSRFSCLSNLRLLDVVLIYKQMRSKINALVYETPVSLTIWPEIEPNGAPMEGRRRHKGRGLWE